MLWEQRSGDNIPKAIALYQQATAHDPNYALAYAGLAQSYALLPFYTGAHRRDAMSKAKEAALKALSLDSNLAEAHTALGNVLVHDEVDLTGAMREFKRAIELKPNDATAHHWFGNDHPGSFRTIRTKLLPRASERLSWIRFRQLVTRTWHNLLLRPALRRVGCAVAQNPHIDPTFF